MGMKQMSNKKINKKDYWKWLELWQLRPEFSYERIHGCEAVTMSMYRYVTRIEHAEVNLVMDVWDMHKDHDIPDGTRPLQFGDVLVFCGWWPPERVVQTRAYIFCHRRELKDRRFIRDGMTSFEHSTKSPDSPLLVPLSRRWVSGANRPKL